MKKVRLGKSGMVVTKVGFGGIPIQRLSEKEAVKVVRAGLDMKIDWLDTANGYGPSEGMIGKAIKGYDREKIKIFTKGAGRDKEDLKGQVEKSFNSLGVDYIDLYQFHIVNDKEMWGKMKKGGAVELMLGYKERGLIKHIGATSHVLDAVLMLMDEEFIEVAQYPFNFIVKEEGEKVLAKCKEKDIGFIAMKPFGGGVLEDAKVCIRFFADYPEVAPDPGFEKISEIEEVAALVEEGIKLTDDDRARMEKIRQEVGTQFCRQCEYCSPCPNEVSIITLMTMDSLVKRMSKEELLEGWVGENAKTIENCAECGMCEEKCPYGLPIRKRIKEGAEMLRKFRVEIGK